jgi:hypothetical protein
MVMPSAFASSVDRELELRWLLDSGYRPGFAPLRILSTKPAAYANATRWMKIGHQAAGQTIFASAESGRHLERSVSSTMWTGEPETSGRHD